MNGSLGSLPKLNMYSHVHVTVLSLSAEDERYVLPCFIKDKALIVDGSTGRILADSFAISSIGKGDASQGTKSQAASAIAQEGFFAVACSEDSCSVEGQIAGDLKIFPGTRECITIPVKHSAKAGETKTKGKEADGHGERSGGSSSSSKNQPSVKRSKLNS
eukprot:TRINITY_DN23209_c0_g1_i2.p1 TRINITY_DN23209_c0_g1~~TRINITY_DN23209_c0_g1_i2.p1  ORF type:complete len:161 (-),score=23.34 TRINITY_DN23209_c0_g1_i2:43-525(-)